MIETINQAMDDAIGEGVFPSAQLLVVSKGRILINNAYGGALIETVFDVASLTKVIATTTLIMQAVSDNKLGLEDPIAHYLPKCHPEESITIRHLLSHSSGLPAWQPYYQNIPMEYVGTTEGRREILDAVFQEPLTYKAGYQSIYSDLGFILLGEIIERVTGEPINKLFADRIAKPLGLTSTFFVPINLRTQAPKHLSTSFAPTEHCPWRKKVIQGEVHDQNCYAMGGVAGHAGLFSNTTDIQKFISEFIACYNGTGKLLSEEIVQRFLPFHYKLTECNTTWLLGWDRPSHTNSQAGKHFSSKSIGHMGYTGCSMWIDLEKDFYTVLLTNRIHPTTMNEKIRSFRPRLNNLIYEELIA